MIKTMLEKFHQFNRQDNPKKVEEGMADMEEKLPVNELLVSHSEVNHETSQKAEDGIISEEERERLFSRLEKPRDVLNVPSLFRKEAINALREKIVDRYLSISSIQALIFDRVEELYKAGTLNLTLVIRAEIDEELSKHRLTQEDYEVIGKIFEDFRENYENLYAIKDLSQEELLQRFVRNRALFPKLKGHCQVKITPFSINFAFDDVEDFRLFVSTDESQSKERFKDTYGLSFYHNGYPVTASGYKYDAENTFRHETQHKKFNILTFDKILSDDEAERSTRNEILAFFSERGNPYHLVDDVLDYRFSEKYRVDNNALYEKTLKDAVTAIQQLLFMHFSKEEILGLLSKEKLVIWPKIARRIEKSVMGKDLILRRKKKRDFVTTEKLDFAQKQKDEVLVTKMGPVLKNGIVITRVANKQGKFFEKVTKQTILDTLRKQSVIIKESDVFVPNPITAVGEHTVELVLRGGNKPFVVKVEGHFGQK